MGFNTYYLLCAKSYTLFCICYFIRVLFSSCFPVFTHRALCDSYNSYLIHTYHYFINLSVPVFVIHIIYWTVPL